MTKWADTQYCCGLCEIGSFGFTASKETLIEHIQLCLKYSRREWKEPGKTLAAFATTVPVQENAIKALKATGFKPVGTTHGMHGNDYDITMWFRPAD